MFRQFPKISFCIAVLFSILLSQVSCTNADKKKDSNIAGDNLFFDYQVTAEEGNDNLTVLLQYRVGDEEGDGITIGEPGK